MNASPTIIVMTSDYVVPNAYVRQGRMNASPTLTVGAPLMAPVLMRVRNVMTPLMAPVFNARSERNDAIDGAHGASDYIAPNAYIRQGRMNASPTIIVMTSDYVVPNTYVRQGRINASPTITVGAPVADRSAFVAAAAGSSPDAPDVYRYLFTIVIKLTRLNLGVDTLRF